MTSSGVRERYAALTPARRGVVIFIVAGLVFIAADTLTKFLVSDAPVVDVVFGRHLSAFVAVLLLAGRTNPRRLLRARRPGLQLLRGLAMFGTTVLFFLSLSLLPIGTVSALSNANPLFVLLLAGPLLREKVPLLAKVGAVVGFAGVLAITGIDVGSLDLRLFAPIVFAIVYALFSILSRSLRGEDADVTVFWSAVVCLVAGTAGLVLFPSPVAPQPAQWLGIGLLGILALGGHWLLVAAFRITPASDLAPLGYLGVLWSFLVGALVFGDPLVPSAVLGAVTIVAGGVVALRAVGGEDEAMAAPAIDRGDPAHRRDRVSIDGGPAIPDGIDPGEPLNLRRR
ncbi:MAG TPA: DMT family transporter [Candidatus Limnocylindria bacterium]|nr:DMT family transporter [Candidatus Limnocylindria bacterium]